MQPVVIILLVLLVGAAIYAAVAYDQKLWPFAEEVAETTGPSPEKSAVTQTGPGAAAPAAVSTTPEINFGNSSLSNEATGDQIESYTIMPSKNYFSL